MNDSPSSSPSLSWLGLATIWFGGMISIPSLLIGSTLIAGLGFWDTLLATAIGCAVVGTYMSMESIAAVEQRLDTVELASNAFGSSGARIVVGLALGISLLGWFGVQSALAGSSAARILQISLGWNLSAQLASVVLGLLMMLSAAFGFKWLKWLNYLAVPCKIALVGFAVYMAIKANSFEQIYGYHPAPAARMNMMTAVGIAIGFFAVGGVIAPDYARHAKDRRAAVLGSLLGLLPAALGLAACGAMLAIFQHTYDIVEIYSKLGMPVLALSVLILATWTTNVMNVYSSGLAITQVLGWPESKRRLATLLAGIAGALLAGAGILDNFMGFLMLLTVTIPPIAGVLVGDYWLARRYARAGQSAFRWQGLIAWSCGVGIMLTLQHPLKNVLGILIAALAYWTFTMLPSPRAKRPLSN